MAALKDQHCRALEGQPALAAAELDTLLAQVDGWAERDGAIEKRFDFPDFHHTMAFVNAVAWVAHAQDHHPDMAVGYNRCTLRWSTHSVGGISHNDFICAARVDALLP